MQKRKGYKMSKFQLSIGEEEMINFDVYVLCVNSNKIL